MPKVIHFVTYQDGQDLCIDVPPEFGRDVSRYNATLGHKANHDFQVSIPKQQTVGRDHFMFIIFASPKLNIHEP